MRLDRLLGILTILLQYDRVSAPILAEKFEVSRRTISRDIDALCQAGIPIVTQQGGNGGISIAAGFKLDKSVLTSDELSSIVAALKGLGSVTKEAQIERVLDKLSASKDTVVSLQESMVIDLSSHYRGRLTEKIGLIKQAIRESRLIEFDYFYDKGTTHRLIEPYFVSFQWSDWYVFGFCLKRHDFRLFKLTRLWELKLGTEFFHPRAIPPEKRKFNTRFTNHLKLVALFDPSVRYQLIDAYGPQSFSETTDGLLRIEIGFTNEDYIVGWLLSFGDKARVLEPATLAERISQIAIKIVANYK